MNQETIRKSITEITTELDSVHATILAKYPHDAIENQDLANAVGAIERARVGLNRISNADFGVKDSKSEMRRAGPQRLRLADDGERPQTPRQNIIELFNRLSDGREIKTDADFQQWVYEYLDSFSREIGMDHTPIDIFPAITRVMVEWCEATSGCNCDKENAQALARAIGALTVALERCLEDLNEESQPPPLTWGGSGQGGRIRVTSADLQHLFGIRGLSPIA
jgi:hypothetical protein